MLSMTLLVATELAALFALSIVAVNASACAGSICLGNAYINGSPSLILTSESGSKKTEESKLIAI